jgi:abequosyltransferase
MGYPNERGLTEPLLTIAIPTFNREKSLRRSLGTIVRQLNDIEAGWDLVEFLVSDNCSTDNTRALVQEFAQQARIKYSANSTNLGMEGNFLTCFERAQGTYVWTISDDDVLVDGALQKVIDLLALTPVDLVYMKPKFLLGEVDSFSTEFVDFRFERVTAEYFALRANGLLSFLSAVIVNKDRYMEISGDRANIRRYVGTWLAHYEWIYTLIAYGSHFYIATRPIIRARTGATGGYDLFQVFGDFYTAIGKERLPLRPRMRADLESAMLYMHIPGFIARCRANIFGKFEYVPERIAQQIFAAYGDSVFYRFVIRNQLFGGERVAAAAYRISQIYSRCWMLLRRLLTRRSGDKITD